MKTYLDQLYFAAVPWTSLGSSLLCVYEADVTFPSRCDVILRWIYTQTHSAFY